MELGPSLSYFYGCSPEPNGVDRLNIWWKALLGSPNCGTKTIVLEDMDWNLLPWT